MYHSPTARSTQEFPAFVRDFCSAEPIVAVESDSTGVSAPTNFRAAMSNLRIIPRLDIKGPNLIKGVQLEGLRVIGDPHAYALRYYESGADELLYMDIVASLYGRNNLSDIIKRAARDVYVPITVGGGIRSVEDARDILRSGADKVAINTAAIARPELITQVARRFGSQAMVLSIEAKHVGPLKWEVYTDNGRERTGLDVLQWVRRGVELGAGEVLITAVDREGTRSGFDLELIRLVSEAVPVPVIASGGMGSIDHFLQAAMQGRADGVAMADVLHYSRISLPEIRKAAHDAGLPVRRFDA
jgi:cyclase